MNIKEKSKSAVTYIVGGVTLFTILLANMSVFSRLLRIPFSAGEEALRYTFVWLVAICTALAFNENGLISITFIEEAFLGKNKVIPYKIMRGIIYLSSMFFSFICFYFSGVICLQQLNTNKISPVMEMPMAYVTLGLTTGCGVWFIYTVIKTVKLIKIKDIHKS